MDFEDVKSYSDFIHRATQIELMIGLETGKGLEAVVEILSALGSAIGNTLLVFHKIDADIRLQVLNMVFEEIRDFIKLETGEHENEQN